MSQKRGKVPAHIQPKQFQHPEADSAWINILNKVEDPTTFMQYTPFSCYNFIYRFHNGLVWSKRLGGDVLPRRRGRLFKMAWFLRRYFRWDPFKMDARKGNFTDPNFTTTAIV